MVEAVIIGLLKDGFEFAGLMQCRNDLETEWVEYFNRQKGTHQCLSIY